MVKVMLGMHIYEVAFLVAMTFFSWEAPVVFLHVELEWRGEMGWLLPCTPQTLGSEVLMDGQRDGHIQCFWPRVVLCLVTGVAPENEKLQKEICNCENTATAQSLRAHEFLERKECVQSFCVSLSGKQCILSIWLWK